jgi:deoxyribose-phosphate aldolase
MRNQRKININEVRLGSSIKNKKMLLSDLAKMIDHSLLHPTLTDNDIIKGCELAADYKVAAVCIKPYSIDLVKNRLINSDVVICAVAGFPHGNSSITIKLKESEELLKKGATEIDTVVNIGKVLSADWEYVSDEIEAINQLVINNNAILKVIFENDFLGDKQIIRLCEICSKIKVAFVKTSTGYGFVKQANGFYSYKGATDHHLMLMRKNCIPEVKIKAAGGIRTLADLLRVKSMGVSRIGASATRDILQEAKKMMIADQSTSSATIP